MWFSVSFWLCHTQNERERGFEWANVECISLINEYQELIENKSFSWFMLQWLYQIELSDSCMMEQFPDFPVAHNSIEICDRVFDFELSKMSVEVYWICIMFKALRQLEKWHIIEITSSSSDSTFKVVEVIHFNCCWQFWLNASTRKTLQTETLHCA